VYWSCSLSCCYVCARGNEKEWGRTLPPPPTIVRFHFLKWKQNIKHEDETWNIKIKHKTQNVKH
jgi:hypothetical protein